MMMMREVQQSAACTLTSTVSLPRTEGLATCPSEEIKTDSPGPYHSFPLLPRLRHDHEVSHRQIDGATLGVSRAGQGGAGACSSSSSPSAGSISRDWLINSWRR
ncbi:uncharacterized protein LOC116840714 [Odontomachus brunneus]|uniref:uncharacterized protein LOC116840714 n=1 Tax=Odontomachus brunneus TaxID=486640 RepID=UPI0013F223A8|nr:uncharacterized protein LOC116840714 [Odontomachus brunneus]